ncbi:MAG: hypothetical protein AABX14_00215, partial [Candidatus Aenigmatarchaeota archaeon]
FEIFLLMSKDEEYVPIDITRPEEFLEHEFYLAIPRDNLFKDIRARLEARVGIVRRARRATRDFMNKLRGQERRDFADYDGAMIEVIERQPHSLQGYGWPGFNRAVLEDGARVATIIPKDEAFRSYIFVPAEAQPVNATGYRMAGIMRPYDLHTNSLEESGQRVGIYFDRVPQRKAIDGNLMCL